MWPWLATHFQGYHAFSATFEVPGTKSLLYSGLTWIKADIRRPTAAEVEFLRSTDRRTEGVRTRNKKLQFKNQYLRRKLKNKRIRLYKHISRINEESSPTVLTVKVKIKIYKRQTKISDARQAC
jgi:hypothetical protein